MVATMWKKRLAQSYKAFVAIPFDTIEHHTIFLSIWSNHSWHNGGLVKQLNGGSVDRGKGLGLITVIFWLFDTHK